MCDKVYCMSSKKYIVDNTSQIWGMITTSEIAPSPALAPFVRCYTYREFDTKGVFSIISGTFLARSDVVEGFKSFSSVLLLGIAEHVQGDTVVDILLRANPINCLLHFAVAAVAALHGIGG